MDVVFHVATAAPTASNAQNQALMAAVNIDGTRNVVEACVRGGVPRLVLTSSASVVFNGRDLVDVTEDEPYAARPMDYYTHTKIEGRWRGRSCFFFSCCCRPARWLASPRAAVPPGACVVNECRVSGLSSNISPSIPLTWPPLLSTPGEKLVLAANGSGGLATVALRPSGIFGEYDLLTVPTVVEKARQGKMKYIIGNGKNLMDWTYAGNVAQVGGRPA